MTESQVFLEFLMREQLEKTIDKFSDIRLVQRQFEIDPNYFGVTADDIMAWAPEFVTKLHEYGIKVLFQVTDVEKVKVDLWKDQR